MNGTKPAVSWIVNTKVTVIPPILAFAEVHSGNLCGLGLLPIRVEVASRRGPPGFELAGLAEASVREARVRVGSALSRQGVCLEEYALTVSLAPANLRKGGSCLDLALALGVLLAVGKVPKGRVDGWLVLGELSLDGSIRPVPGILPMLSEARARGTTVAIVPAENAQEASQLDGLTVYAPRSLEELVLFLNEQGALHQVARSTYAPDETCGPDLADVRGQGAGKRALLVAAAGHHHSLLVGPPGSGKSLLARRLSGLLPKFNPNEALETSAIHSACGLLGQAGVLRARPFRSPHHTVSDAGLIGGGSQPRPGEISLAHRGVLFLDELPEFRRSALEALRQPLEEHVVRIVRSQTSAVFPAHPLLIAAMNPCPCGQSGHPKIRCRCSETARAKYLAKLSGPLLDRIDLHVVVPPLDVSSWAAGKDTSEPSERSHTYQRKVAGARAVQLARYKRGEVSGQVNADLSLVDLERVAAPDAEGRELLGQASRHLHLSARGYVRVLRIARTLADLDGKDGVMGRHIGEAVRFRMFIPDQL